MCLCDTPRADAATPRETPDFGSTCAVGFRQNPATNCAILARDEKTCGFKERIVGDALMKQARRQRPLRAEGIVPDGA
jgi:hypothetical protein